MNFASFIVGAIVLVFIVADLIFIFRNRKKGKKCCGCDCGTCSENCKNQK